MKIIHIVHGRANPNGANGISRVVYFLNKYEKLQGIDSEIWAIVDGTKKHYTYERDRFVKVECYPRVKILGNKTIIEDLIANKSSIDLVHFHLIWFYDKNIIASALKKHHIPFIITTHGTYSKPHAYTGKRLLAKWLFETKYLNMADECHILTPEEGMGLYKYGYQKNNFIVPNGFEEGEMPEHINDDYFRQQPFANKTILLTVCVLRQDKNIDRILEALALLPKVIRDKYVYVVVGPDHKNNAKKYKLLARKLQVEESFFWLGPLFGKDKYDAISSAHCFMMASDSEGFSMAIIDAMACAKPMILTSGCNMNYVSKSSFFIKCEPYPADIARAINEFDEMGRAVNQLGFKSKEILLERLTWQKIALEMKKNYERIISSCRKHKTFKTNTNG